MNMVTWIIQGLVATTLAASGVIIIILPKEKLAEKLSWVNEYSDGMRYFICISKILGSVGLILPMYLNILPILTPIAACFIAFFMVFATRYHLIKQEYKDIPATVVFFIFAMFIAYNRF